MSDKYFKTLDDLCTLLINERGLACDSRDELKHFLALNLQSKCNVSKQAAAHGPR